VVRRANAYVVASLAACACVLAAPAAGSASSGGSGLALPPNTNGDQQSIGQVQQGDVVLTASADGMTISARASTFLRHQLRISGSVPSTYAGDIVVIERNGHQTGWTWAATARATVASDGSFSAVWRTNHIGRFEIRAVIEHAAASTYTPNVSVTIYRPALATIYGPGFWGSRTACGEVLGRHTLGVANRTLKCGMDVAIYYDGRTIVVPVIDRGPYANGADWDLTEATAAALGMTATDTIGAVSLPPKS
jgi:rare lipoprotein A